MIEAPRRKAQLYVEEDLSEIEVESAKDYVTRISKKIVAMEETHRIISKAIEIKEEDIEETSSIVTETSSMAIVFRMDSSSPTKKTSKFPSLKKTSSNTTQETASISDDESSQDEDGEIAASSEQAETAIISILRRKEKLGEIARPTTGSAVTFCPTTVFPDPNAKPVKRKRVKRLPKPQKSAVIIEPVEIPAENYDNLYQCEEPRRLQRRAQQNQHNYDHLYQSYDLQSPSSDLLMPTESFYVFR